MKRRLLLVLVAVAAGVALGWWFTRQPVGPAKPAAKPAVTIQDGKTIDFSSGKPVVKDSPGEKAIIDATVKEMDEAAKGVKFGPPEKKKEPEPPPKK